MTSDNLFRDYPEVVFMISFFSAIFVLQKTVFWLLRLPLHVLLRLYNILQLHLLQISYNCMRIVQMTGLTVCQTRLSSLHRTLPRCLGKLRSEYHSFLWSYGSILWYILVLYSWHRSFLNEDILLQMLLHILRSVFLRR